MSGTCMEFIPKRKFADGHGTDGEQACLAGLSAKIDDNAAFGDVQHVTSGLEEGRAQNGHSSGAHSTPRNQCRDAGVVARWLFVHQLAERWIKGHWGWCACWDMRICGWVDGDIRQMDRVWMLKWVLALMKSIP